MVFDIGNQMHPLVLGHINSIMIIFLSLYNIILIMLK